MPPGFESTYDPSGKFKRVSAGEMLLPAECANCRNPSHVGGYVDTRIDLDFFGILYFCEDCAFEMTTVFPSAPYHTMRNRINTLEQEIVAKDARLATLERALDGFSAARLIDRDVSIVSGIVIGADVPTEQDADDLTALLSGQQGEDDSESTESGESNVGGVVIDIKRRDEPIDLI